jgi:transposase-like protein
VRDAVSRIRNCLAIFVDETIMRDQGERRRWVWVAFEPGLTVFLAFHISYNRSMADAHTFLKRLRSRYGDEAHLDGGDLLT